MLERSWNKIQNIHSLYELRLPVLFFGLALWTVIPIVGIFPILLSIQLDLLDPHGSRPQWLSLNNLLLVLVLLTLAIYVSSFDVFADTRVYLDLYQGLDDKGIFDNFIVENRYEFGLFLLLYPINILSNGSEYWCLFVFALLINAIVIFYISKGFSRKFYPSLLIIVFSTSFYYSHIFYMRQFVAIMFTMMALVCLESNWYLFILWSFLAVFSHLTSAIYVAVLVALKLGHFLKSRIKIKLEKKDLALIYLLIGVVLGLLAYVGFKIANNPNQVYGYISQLVDLLPDQDLGSALQTRVDNNDGRDTETFALTEFRLLAIMGISWLIGLRRFKKIDLKTLGLYCFYLISIFGIIFILVTGFNQRIIYIFLAFYGFFFSIGLDESNRLKPFGQISLVVMLVAAANTFNFLVIQDRMLDLGGWSFFDGSPLSMSFIEYVSYFFSSI